MAHFAQLDKDNTVTQVIVVHNNELLDEDHQESEAQGIAFCQSLFGSDTVWRQTSYNGSIRKNYAGVGYIYDANLDAFIPPKPYPSWTLNQDICQWQPPVPYPADGKQYIWNESTISWTSL